MNQLEYQTCTHWLMPFGVGVIILCPGVLDTIYSVTAWENIYRDKLVYLPEQCSSLIAIFQRTDIEDTKNIACPHHFSPDPIWPHVPRQ